MLKNGICLVHLITNSNLNIPAYLSGSAKKKKKIISIYGLIAELNRCFFFSQPISFYYYSRYISKLISLFKQTLLVNNYYQVLLKKLSMVACAVTKYIYIIFLNTSILYSYNKLAQAHIQIISKPRRLVYITYKQLFRLSENGAYFYILNTTLGLLLHKEALQHRQGGQLVCKIK